MSFEKKRKELLAAILCENYTEADKVYEEITRRIVKSGFLPEKDQKAIAQIQLSVKRFSPKLKTHYTEAFQDRYNIIKKILSQIARSQTGAVEYIEYDDWHEKIGLSKKHLNTMFTTVAMLQITAGCSNYCRRCNEWALPGVRKHFSFDAVKLLIEELFQSGNASFSLYGASDPLDWKDRDKDIADILSFMNENNFSSEFGLLTKIPKTKKEIAKKLLLKDADIGVSITRQNRLIVEEIEKKTGKKFKVQHDVENLEIPAGLDEDFSTVKSSITDYYGTEITPEGASLVVPAFTSALQPTGQCRIPVTSKTRFFLEKKIGRRALPVEYFKPLKAINLNGKRFTLKKLLNVQIENILQDNGRENLTPPGMMNLNEYFRIFDADTVRQRKKLVPAVIEDLKKKFPRPGKENHILKRKIESYLDFCDMEKTIKTKILTFSFYLKAIAEYLKTHGAEREIVLFLRRKEKHLGDKFKGDPETFLEKSNTGGFDLFQSFMFRLLNNPEDDRIQKFVDNNPVIFDSAIDRFVLE